MTMCVCVGGGARGNVCACDGLACACNGLESIPHCNVVTTPPTPHTHTFQSPVCCRACLQLAKVGTVPSVRGGKRAMRVLEPAGLAVSSRLRRWVPRTCMPACVWMVWVGGWYGWVGGMGGWVVWVGVGGCMEGGVEAQRAVSTGIKAEPQRNFSNTL
jgi:hypothetical protein